MIAADLPSGAVAEFPPAARIFSARLAHQVAAAGRDEYVTVLGVLLSGLEVLAQGGGDVSVEALADAVDLAVRVGGAL